MIDVEILGRAVLVTILLMLPLTLGVTYIKFILDYDPIKENYKLKLLKLISNKYYDIVSNKLEDYKLGSISELEYKDFRYKYINWSPDEFIKGKRLIDIKDVDLYIQKHIDYFWTKNRFHTNKKFVLKYYQKDFLEEVMKKRDRDMMRNLKNHEN